MPDLRIEYWPLSRVQAHPSNPKEHDVAEITRSIYRFGFVVPALIDSASGLLAAGHSRAEALQQAKAAGKQPPDNIKVMDDGEWAMPIILGATFQSEDELEAFLIAANQTTIAGGWDNEKLISTLTKLREQGRHMLSGTGYTSQQIDRLVKLTQTKQRKDAGDAPEIEISPELLERHDYVVFYADNELDWNVIAGALDLHRVESAPVGQKTLRQKGIGRVLPASVLIGLIEASRGDGAE